MNLKNCCFKAMAVLGVAMFISNQSQAQSQAKITIKVGNILGIKVASGKEDVVFNYVGVPGYADQTVEKAGQLLVTSSTGYNIGVSADGEILSGGVAGNTSTIPIGIVKVTIPNNADQSLTTGGQKALATGPITLASSTKTHSYEVPLDVNYFIAGSDAKTNIWDASIPADDYVQTITYSITAQ